MQEDDPASRLEPPFVFFPAGCSRYLFECRAFSREMKVVPRKLNLSSFAAKGFFCFVA
jgi:hypothetical protein